MRWNWQQPSWPNFHYRIKNLEHLEKNFLYDSGVMYGALQTLQDSDQDLFRIDLLTAEALHTSEIEGESLERASVQSSLRKHFGLQMDGRKIPSKEAGIVNLMINLYRNWQSPLTHDLLFNWHKLLMTGRSDLQDIGKYRSFVDAMRIVSGPLHRPKVHFEAPPADRVPAEMTKFIQWFNDTSPNGPSPLLALTRASIAHLYFVSIHPFEDGNGRIARALSVMALAQSVKKPGLIAISTIINTQRNQYYEALEANNKDLDIDNWLNYFSELILDAMKLSKRHVDFVLEKGKLLTSLEGLINNRQRKALIRMFREGPSGFRGGLSAKNYMSITGASPPTTTRDLKDLVEKGALVKKGQLRHTRYFLNIE